MKNRSGYTLTWLCIGVLISCFGLIVHSSLAHKKSIQNQPPVPIYTDPVPPPEERSYWDFRSEKETNADIAPAGIS